MSSSFVIGSAAAGYLVLHVRVPLDGSTYESVQKISTSLGGTSTLNRVAVKRRYAWPLTMMRPDDWVALRDLWLDSPGPYWLWDASERFAPAPEPPYTPSAETGWLAVLIEGLARQHVGARVLPTITMREI
jgi:hypothetical protein